MKKYNLPLVMLFISAASFLISYQPQLKRSKLYSKRFILKLIVCDRMLPTLIVQSIMKIPEDFFHTKCGKLCEVRYCC